MMHTFAHSCLNRVASFRPTASIRIEDLSHVGVHEGSIAEPFLEGRVIAELLEGFGVIRKQRDDLLCGSKGG